MARTVKLVSSKQSLEEILFPSIWPQFLKDPSTPFDSIRIDCVGKVVHRRLYGNSERP